VTPYHADPWLTVYQGDCREVMRQMEPESVHCVVTSPPYWGLRDYGTASWVGGDEGCDHVGSVMRTAPPGTAKQASNFGASSVSSGDCRCGAIRQDSQLGLEPTPEEFVANMVDVFREVRRVLRKDGTCWVNLGDSYAASGGDDRNGSSDGAVGRGDRPNERRRAGLKPKDLVGIPWRVAFALQADGWYLRSDIIWAKPNPMPESVTDRPTKSHEYLFLLTKSARYYYDADAVREAAEYGYSPTPMMFDGIGDAASQPERKFGAVQQGGGGSRNLRTVWNIATQPYPGAHFATFPSKLVEPCVKAGSPAGGVVLDPFAGSGTVGMVAQSLSRRAVLIDLNGEYLVQAMSRNQQTPLGLETA
jgi:site-specific DNA-methyltransferase (adenine-specific)